MWSTKLIDLTLGDAVILLLVYFGCSLVIPAGAALGAVLWNAWKIGKSG